MPDVAAASRLKKCFTGSCRLPAVLPLPQLLAAAARLPIDEKIVQGALLLEAREDSSPLFWRICEVLRETLHETVGAAARLQLAGKLTQLFDEVDSHMPLAAGENPFTALKDAGGSHEALVACNLWARLAEEEVAAAPGRVGGRQVRMRRLAAVLPPCLAVCDEQTTAVERWFYAQCKAEIVELSLLPREQMWRQALTVQGRLPSRCEHDAAQGQGETLSAAAALALVAIQEFLAENDGKIGLVIYDRLLARRLRALAEAAGILIADKSGWRADSLSYGAALAVGAKLLLDEFDLAAIGRVLTPPFYADCDLQAAADDWRKCFAETCWLPATMDALCDSCVDFPVLAAIVDDLCAARRQAEGARAPAEWLAWLLENTAKMLASWRRDAVAEALRDRLHERVACSDVQVSGGEFLLWLAEVMANEYVSDGEVESRVEFVAPGGGWQFDALLLLGCAGKVVGEDSGWCGECERQWLGLPSRGERLERARRRFSHLLATHRRIAAVWCGVDETGKPVSPYPFWHLFAVHCRRHGRLREILRPSVDAPALGVPPLPPRAAAAAALPERLPLSAANALMTCPYLFYSSTLLALADKEAVALDDLSPRLKGILLHRALAAFSRDSKAMTAREALMRCWRQVLARELQGNRPGLALFADYWRINSDWFIDWELQRRRQGWETGEVEHVISAVLPFASGDVEIRGRIDRLDVAASAKAVIDYKSHEPANGRRLAAGEVPQLPLYAFFAKADEQLLCKPLAKQGRCVESKADARRVAARLRHVLRQIDAGIKMPANGALEVCVCCRAAGVCRREHSQT